MAGVALLLDLLRRNCPGSCASSKSLYPCGLLSTTVAASAAAAAAAGRHFAPRGLFSGPSFAFCDAGVEWTEDHIPGVESAFENFSFGKSSSEDTVWQYSLKNTAKEYPIELKPLFSAFGLKPLAMTSLRSFLLFYLPLLEPRQSSEDDDDLLQDAPRDEPVDLVVPFKKSLKQIARETSIVTTRRVLERAAVHYLSQRMAWKLLKAINKVVDNFLPRRIWRPLQDLLPRLSACSLSDRRDQWVWQWKKDGCFSVRSAYNLIFYGALQHGLQSQVWKPKSSLKVRCILCGEESIDHISVGCAFSRTVWRVVAARTDGTILHVGEVCVFIDNWRRHWPTKGENTIWWLILHATLRMLWGERNNHIFSRTARDAKALFGGICSKVGEWAFLRCNVNQYNSLLFALLGCSFGCHMGLESSV